jgi:hypothetical protein
MPGGAYLTEMTGDYVAGSFEEAASLRLHLVWQRREVTKIPLDHRGHFACAVLRPRRAFLQEGGFINTVRRRTWE